MDAPERVVPVKPGGSIAGTVRDDAVGTPLSGVTVSAYTGSGLLVASGLTNALGTYQLDGLGAGQYFLGTSNLIGYTDELYENVYGDERWREQFARMNTAAPFGEREETRSWQI